MLRQTVFGVFLSFCALPASACVVAGAMDFRDILKADVVIKGEVINYQIVEGPGPGRLADYAKMDVLVFQTYKSDGDVGQRLTITWDNSTFGEPADLTGRDFVFALRHAWSPSLPLRAPSATILRVPEPEFMTILQAPCAGAFIFDARGAVARAVEMLFDGHGNADVEAEVLAEYLRMNGKGGLY